ncbi:MAG TPA: GNAT family protein [Dongiaceae bacterium]|jgi:RimJ/RimL family protein N-acetyltransferase|nr:GNAT family protein [Dongiaceae bacterium]
MLVYQADEQLAAWIGGQIGVAFSPPYVCIGIVRGETLVAAVLYNDFQPPNIQMTIASITPRWASRQVIARLLAYPFLELQCLRVSAVTRATNEDARRFLARLGFHQEGHHPLLFPDDDGVSYGLMRSDAEHWLEGLNNAQQSSYPTDPAGSGRSISARGD